MEQKENKRQAFFSRIDDSFKKIVIMRDDIIPWHDDNGTLFLGVEQFLLDEKAIDL